MENRQSLEQFLEDDLEICPRLKDCIPEPSDSQIEDYCCLNYEECEIFLQYKQKQNIYK